MVTFVAGDDERKRSHGHFVLTSHTSTRPRVGAYKPAIVLSNVVFPAPLSPTSPTSSPARITMLMSSSERSRPSSRAPCLRAARSVRYSVGRRPPAANSFTSPCVVRMTAASDILGQPWFE